MHNHKVLYLILMLVGGIISGMVICNQFEELLMNYDIVNKVEKGLYPYVLTNFNLSLLLIIIISLLSFSLFGIIIDGIFMFYKGFMLSFNILGCFLLYKVNAIYVIALTLLPFFILEIIAYCLVMVLGIKISMVIINACLNGKKMVFKSLINNLLTRLLLACFILFITYLFQGFVLTKVIDYMI